MPNASTPWSTRTVAEGGTDSPVGDLVPVPDEIKPVVNTGFIANTGKFTGIAADDLQFTFQDPSQALGAGASIFIDPINMLTHDILIFAILDSSGNAVNVDLILENPTTLLGPYTPFGDVGVNGDRNWMVNQYPAGGTGTGTLADIFFDGNETLTDTWEFIKVIGLRGTLGRLTIRSNEGADAGTISTAYLRLV